MNVFELRDQLIEDYQSYIKSFMAIKDDRIRQQVEALLTEGAFWPDPLIQLNPGFASGGTIAELVAAGTLHPECARIFSRKQQRDDSGTPLRLHRHQTEAILAARTGRNYVLTTGTGSGKSLSYIVPIVDHVLRRGSGQGIQAIVVYPMNALANSQERELEKFLQYGYPAGQAPVSFAKYTGQEDEQSRKQIIESPPDILLTNYVMLELILTRPAERGLIAAAQGLQFLVLDELHTYRGRQGADVALLVRRVRDRLTSPLLQTVGTSATLAGAGPYEEQRAEVAETASQLFGARVDPAGVIGETLERVTTERNWASPAVQAELAARCTVAPLGISPNYDTFVEDPLAGWVESTFGVTTDSRNGRLVRATPTSITGDHGAAQALSKLAGVAVPQAAQAIGQTLLTGYNIPSDTDRDRPTFAFRLHQFIRRGDTVYVSLEPEEQRYITIFGQQFKPGSRDHVLLPVAFCRECGQEYLLVRRDQREGPGERVFTERVFGDQAADGRSEAGFLYISSSTPWPTESDAIFNRLPTEWLEGDENGRQVLKNRRKELPQAVRIGPDGREAADGIAACYIGAPFRFCLHCGVSYDFQQSSDFAKLGTLSSEGRSTATTILSLAVVRALRGTAALEKTARKLLSFTDNRQDASLQAGHFNDFIETGMLRGALYQAVANAPQGISHEALTHQVAAALELPVEKYAADPAVKFAARKETDRALREVLGYRLYRDLKRGWRITAPNLEQTGLLEVQYQSLDELCADEESWLDRHPLLAGAGPAVREEVARVLLDYMRRELAIKVSYLDPAAQEQIGQLSNQRLIPPWAIDENEQGKLEHSAVLYPRTRRPADYGGNLFVSGRGSFGQYLRRPHTFGRGGERAPTSDLGQIIGDLLDTLRIAGLVEIVAPAEGPGEVNGYQIPAAAMRWVVADGTRVVRDPIRVPSASQVGAATNAFFRDFYRTVAGNLIGMEAREHTAQVPYELREDREDRFRSGELPILYCSPTMELGVDIAQLNVVNMRNVPPTPANYAQRSGRAGRSGQPALVFTYCTTGSPHDQYFFNHQDAMVAGAVSPPRIDLANEDLVRAHVQAIWLAATGQNLGRSLKDVLDVEGDEPSLALRPEVREKMAQPAARAEAQTRAAAVLATLASDLDRAGWWTPTWLDSVLSAAVAQFDATAARWRTLYHAAQKQRLLQNRIIGDVSRAQRDKDTAKSLRREAESQLELLVNVDSIGQSDFYSYRYFAAEGFLPGYSFPRLPISAFIPARRLKQRDAFLARPRFLAISEFGPRSIIYHEGSRYVINKVILPVGGGDGDGPVHNVALGAAKLCATCGYLHPLLDGAGPDLCQQCGTLLSTPLQQLFRLQNVATQRRDRISSDEEERQRQGYELITAVRFPEEDGAMQRRTALVQRHDGDLATLTYGQTTTIWRINLGWSRRQNRAQYGFNLDLERGYWAKNEQTEGGDAGDPLQAATTRRVIPYVEDRRNCLLLQLAAPPNAGELVSLMAALKSAIQVRYQLEDNELAAEVLPRPDDPRQILFYEAAEGGAGVLRRLIEEPLALAGVAREALRLCHFDPDTGQDWRRAPRAREDCEAACYNCLMSYGNQGYHRLLDRQAIRAVLEDLRDATVQPGPESGPAGDRLADLLAQTQYAVERTWLHYLHSAGLRLPQRAHSPTAATQPDFLYDGEVQVAVYVDGGDRSGRDAADREALEDAGWTVIHFGAEADWAAQIARYPSVFGVARAGAGEEQV